MKSNQVQMEESVNLWRGLSRWTLNIKAPVVWWSIRHELSVDQPVSGRGEDMWTGPESLGCTQVCSCERVSERRTDELSVYLQAERLRGRSFAEHALIEKVDKHRTHIHTLSPITEEPSCVPENNRPNAPAPAHSTGQRPNEIRTSVFPQTGSFRGALSLRAARNTWTPCGTRRSNKVGFCSSGALTQQLAEHHEQEDATLDFPFLPVPWNSVFENRVSFRDVAQVESGGGI